MKCFILFTFVAVCSALPYGIKQQEVIGIGEQVPVVVRGEKTVIPSVFQTYPGFQPYQKYQSGFYGQTYGPHQFTRPYYQVVGNKVVPYGQAYVQQYLRNILGYQPYQFGQYGVNYPTVQQYLQVPKVQYGQYGIYNPKQIQYQQYLQRIFGAQTNQPFVSQFRSGVYGKQVGYPSVLETSQYYGIQRGQYGPRHISEQLKEAVQEAEEIREEQQLAEQQQLQQQQVVQLQQQLEQQQQLQQQQLLQKQQQVQQQQLTEQEEQQQQQILQQQQIVQQLQQQQQQQQLQQQQQVQQQQLIQQHQLAQQEQQDVLQQQQQLQQLLQNIHKVVDSRIQGQFRQLPFQYRQGVRGYGVPVVPSQIFNPQVPQVVY